MAVGKWRSIPAISAGRLVFCVALALVLVYNASTWQALHALVPLDGIGTGLFYLSFGVFLLACFSLLLTLVSFKYTLKPVLTLLLLVFYVAAVMSTKLFGASFPDWFGTIGESFYTLFQVMTLESWSMGIVRPVMEAYPYAWIFFVLFILLTTFAVLNLFIAIVVDSMSAVEHEEQEQTRELVSVDHDAVLAELRAIRAELAALLDAQAAPPELIAASTSRRD